MSYLRPSSLHEALDALAVAELVIVAGATDHYPARVGTAPAEDVLDISAISDLGEMEQTERGWTIPALTTWRDVIDAPLPPLFDGLKAAARTIGGVQIQNRATVCGNVCNASPAADGVPNLIALGASVELASAAGTRRLPMTAFVTGNRMTERKADELLTAIYIPAHSAAARSTFLKLGARSSLVISVAMVAGVIDLDREGRITSAAIVVGACSAVAQHLPGLEARLLGRTLGPELVSEVTRDDLAPLSPISDIRGTAAYRQDAALVLVRRLLQTLTA